MFRVESAANQQSLTQEVQGNAQQPRVTYSEANPNTGIFVVPSTMGGVEQFASKDKRIAGNAVHIAARVLGGLMGR